MSSFKISLVQMNAISSDKNTNLVKIESFVDQAAKEGAHIICFPELSTCGYDRNFPRSLAENILGHTSTRLVEMSRDYNIVIISGMLEKESDTFYITQVITFPDGRIEKYRKTHLGKYERMICTQGDELPIFQMYNNADNGLQKVKFGVGICYDLHFPEVVASLSSQGAEIVFAPHASPMSGEKRLKIWEKYMGARAYDNRVYLAACNLTCRNCSVKFGGGIGIWDPFGNMVTEYKEGDEKLIFFDIDLDKLRSIRQGKAGHMKNPFYLKDRRGDLYSKYL